MTLILASGSAARRAILTAAGVPFSVRPPALDEEALKASLREAGLPPREQALRLAAEKALSISRQSDGLVIGADQMLALDNVVFDKPADVDAAREQLRRLRGRAHVLLTAVVLAEGDAVVWRRVDEPKLTMRSFSDAFLDYYIDRVGEAALKSVGAYQIEGLGAQLFDNVEGDHFSIMGLPLLPLLDFLRARGVVQA
ncbi:MAG: Maf family protein [Hyphomonadaceae bacterium]|nr:Maf family protein [Hyphomonadaceae bacterium]